MDQVRNAEVLADFLDNKFKLLGIRFGLDPLLSAVPGVGSVLGLLLSAYILLIAYDRGLPMSMRRRMLLNVVADFLVGLVPVVGWIGDFFIRANLKNVRMLRRFVDEQGASGRLIAEN